jgi:hypothetical protein
MGPEVPSDELIDEALQKVLDLLGEDYHCLTGKCMNKRFQSLRDKRIKALRKAIYGMIELEYWESF